MLTEEELQKKMGKSHLYRQLYLFPYHARRKYLSASGGTDSWSADWENQLPCRPG